MGAMCIFKSSALLSGLCAFKGEHLLKSSVCFSIARVNHAGPNVFHGHFGYHAHALCPACVKIVFLADRRSICSSDLRSWIMVHTCVSYMCGHHGSRACMCFIAICAVIMHGSHVHPHVLPATPRPCMHAWIAMHLRIALSLHGHVFVFRHFLCMRCAPYERCMRALPSSCVRWAPS